MLNIHNGDVVAALARKSGVPGEHVAFRETLVTGAVVLDDQWLERRARAIADGHTHDLLRVRTDLVEQEQRLAAATEGEVVFWFEHDLFCLVHLLHLINRFGASRVTLIWSRVPLGTLDEREIFLAFESRAAITPAMLAAAGEAWTAYVSSDPTGLNSLIDRERPEFPFLREGLLLHASRFPSKRNGLGFVEQRLLEMIAAGLPDFPSLFDRFVQEVPSLGFGDSEILRHLRGLAERSVPLVTTTGEPPKLIYAITPAGENVVRAEVDDAAINDPDSWLGGVHLTKENLWRWDSEVRRIIPSRPAVS